MRCSLKQRNELETGDSLHGVILNRNSKNVFCFEWDLAKISQLSAKRPEHRFWFKEEKKCVNPGNQHKKGSRCNTAEIQRRKSKNFLLSEIQLESMWKASNSRKPFPVRKSWTQRNLAPQQQKHFFEWNIARISVISWKQARTFMPWKKSCKSVIWTQKSKNRSFDWGIARISVTSFKKAKFFIQCKKIWKKRNLLTKH